jgi:ketosteroid isomerase-like protein
VAAAPENASSEGADTAVATVDRFQAALVAGDLAGAAAELDPDVVILESGGAEYSASEYLAGHAKRDAEFLAKARIEPRHRTARVSGDLAWVASLTEMEVEQDGRPMTIDGAESMVLRQGPFGWKIVHIHWSSHVRR